MIVEVGMTGSAETLVERADTAQEVGSGSLLVYATPCMVALMEGAACNALEGKLTEGETSVGTRMDVQHLAATPAFDEAGEIGKATHERVVVKTERFLEKAYAKL